MGKRVPCPTDAISLVDEGNKRTIWGRRFTLEPCSRCGAPTLPEQQINHMAERSGLDRAYFELCDECRRRDIAERQSRRDVEREIADAMRGR